MARTPPPTVALIGQADLSEFAPAVAWLERHCSLQTFADCAAAAAALSKNQTTTPWIMLLAAHRGQFENSDVERLHRAAPLARLLLLHGNWCEGETRSGQPLRGVMRVGCSQWEPRAAAELLGIGPTHYAGWSLPRTANAVDVALQTRRLTPIVPHSEASQLSVVTASRDRYWALHDAGTALGFQCFWQREATASVPASSVGVLFDGLSLDEPTAQELAHVVASADTRPVVLLLDFPRWQELARARELGAGAVIAKPFLLGDLEGTLARLIPPARRFAAA